MTEFIGGPSLASNPADAVYGKMGLPMPHQHEPEAIVERANPNETAAEALEAFRLKWLSYEVETAAIVDRFTTDAGEQAVAHVVEQSAEVELQADPAYL